MVTRIPPGRTGAQWAMDADRRDAEERRAKSAAELKAAVDLLSERVQLQEGVTRRLAMPSPTPEMLKDQTFNAIWGAIKSWDVNVPEAYGGYCGANGSHVRLIYDAIREKGEGE